MKRTDCLFVSQVHFIRTRFIVSDEMDYDYCTAKGKRRYVNTASAKGFRRLTCLCARQIIRLKTATSRPRARNDIHRGQFLLKLTNRTIRESNNIEVGRRKTCSAYCITNVYTLGLVVYLQDFVANIFMRSQERS